jgi:hypothetical protein
VVTPVVRLKPDRFFVKDTTRGKAEAIKSDSLKWSADVRSVIRKNAAGDEIYYFEFSTYASDRLSKREIIAVDYIPADGEGETLSLCQPPFFRRKNAAWMLYSRFYADGDLLRDYYMLDSTATGNSISIHKLDRVNRRIEGTFNAQFILITEKADPLNPDTLRFKSGKFWAVLPE